jgi:hypothetical protein
MLSCLLTAMNLAECLAGALIGHSRVRPILILLWSCVVHITQFEHNKIYR